jgi:enterochelin esterase-like enzyme
LQQEIRAAGGPLCWSRTPHERRDGDFEREVWQWLAAGPPARLPVFLSYGREDRFAEAHRMLAGLLPPGRVDSVPGDHDWPAWRTLWARWLDRGLIGQDCAAP